MYFQGKGEYSSCLDSVTTFSSGSSPRALFKCHYRAALENISERARATTTKAERTTLAFCRDCSQAGKINSKWGGKYDEFQKRGNTIGKHDFLT